MIFVESDNATIHITRGDSTQKNFNRLAFQFPILNVETEEEELYEFQPNDKITFVIMEKKGYTKEEILRKEYTLRDLGYIQPTTTPEIILTAEDTKSVPMANKKQTYWYDIVLNDEITILGLDDEGAKKIIIYPESEE